MGGKAAAVAVVEGHGHALALVEGRGDRVRESCPAGFHRRDTVDHHEDLACFPHTSLGVGGVETGQDAVELRAHEPGGPELCRDFDLGPMRARGQRKRDQHRLGPLAAPRSHELIHHLLHRVRLHLVPTLDAVLSADPRPQQAQEVVDLGGRADCGAAAGGGVLLLDRDGRRDPLNAVDERLRHPLEKLLRIGRE